MSPQRGKRTAMFLRVYSWVFCAALWLVVLACVLGAVSNSGEDRPPFLFFTVIVGSMALGSTSCCGPSSASWQEQKGTPRSDDHVVRHGTPFVTRHRREGRFRLAGGRSGRWLVRRADVRGRVGHAGLQSRPPSTLRARASRRFWSSTTRAWTIDSRRFNARMDSIEVLPGALLAAKSARPSVALCSWTTAMMCSVRLIPGSGGAEAVEVHQRGAVCGVPARRSARPVTRPHLRAAASRRDL